MRYLYTFLFFLVLPFILLKLIFKSLSLPAYRKRLKERLGFYSIQLEKCIWIHAVSMGETIAAIPLIKLLQERYSSLSFVVTTMTPTGAERVRMAFGDKVTHLYLPYDLPGGMRRLISHIHPIICIIMETELWPNLIETCGNKHIPVCLVNARLSEKSAKGYGKIASLTRHMLCQLTMIAAHGKADAQRFIALGALQTKVTVTGNIKFDIALPGELAKKSALLRKNLSEDKFVWIAASTHEGEEEIILAAHQMIRKHYPQTLLILVPRHPERFDLIAKLSAQTFMTVRRSLNQAITSDAAVYVGDTLGELLCLYGAADVAFVAGSLIPRGGHNILEPAALGKPIITGHYLFNFAEISDLFVKEQALIKVVDADSLANALISFLQHPQEIHNMGQRALCVINNNRGALAKQFALLSQVIDSKIS